MAVMVAVAASGHRTTRSIHGLLRQDIVTLRLRLRPGGRLFENKLALRFGTCSARGPRGTHPARRRRVDRCARPARQLRQPDFPSAHGRFVRDALEGAIIRRAAEQGMPDAARRETESAIDAQQAVRDDPERFMQLDDQFHRSFAEGVALVGVWAIIERETAQFDRVRILSLPAVTPVTVLIDPHKAISTAVLDRQPLAAEKAIRGHISEVLRIAVGLARRYPGIIVATG